MIRMTAKDSVMRRILIALLSVALVFTMMPLGGRDVVHAQTAGDMTLQEPVLVVTGTGLLQDGAYSAAGATAERSYSLGDLKSLDPVELTYSVKKQNFPYTELYFTARGAALSTLIPNLSSRSDRLAFIADDGYASVFQKGGTYRNEQGNTPGIGNITSSMDYARLDSVTPTVGFDQPRYMYDGFDPATATGTPVESMLAWNYNEGSSDQIPPTAGTEDGNLKLFVGQLGGEGQDGPQDMNGGLLNGGSKGTVNQILVGNHIDEIALTIGSKSYTRKDLLLMEFAERHYEYPKSGGMVGEVDARGIPLSVLLADYEEDDIVNFTAADGIGVDESGMTVGELIEGNFMLAYEKDGEGVYETAKDVPGVYGLLTLYGDGARPGKLVNQITIEKASGIDFSESPYKHITNGGDPDGDGPYKIDAITGATLTVEGPGMAGSAPKSVKEMEGQNKGCFRGVYQDQRTDSSGASQNVSRTYEGIDLYYILHNMEKGTDPIKLTQYAYKVKIKNRNRQTIAELKLSDIDKMHEEGRPALVAYGTAYEDGTNPRPFVFDNGAGGSKALGNYDGCLKFVYDYTKYGGNENYRTFGNMAYIYVEEAEAPGFKHDKAPYDTAENSQYVLTVTGDEIGREVNYKVEDLEKLVEYNEDGSIKDNGYGHRDEYSLANSTYWFVNQYEGVKLWSLLLHSGIDPAKAGDDETMVSFRSTDNYGAFDTFSLKQVADPNQFGYYEKNAEDNNDGKYEANENIRQGDDVTTGDKLRAGYPVLVAYGVNEYPYVISKDLDGFLSGLSNDGGPLRVISGKMNYHHANGSNQAKLLDKIIVGEDTYHYSTHAYQPEGSDYTGMKDSPLQVSVDNETKKITKEYTVKSLEDLVYGEDRTNAQREEARVKDFYEGGNKGFSDLYEGVDLNYFLKEVVGLQGSKGTITFKSGTEGEEDLTVDLEDTLNLTDGYNAKSKVSGLSPVIAFAKNGYPLVEGKESAGYKSSASLSKINEEDTAATSYDVKNSGGPLQVIFPRTSKEDEAVGQNISNVVAIEVMLKADAYAHVKAPYNEYENDTLTVAGEGTRLAGEKTFAIADLEGKQTLAATKDYSFRNQQGKVSQTRYRGLNLYKFLRSADIGLKTNADKVRIYCADKPDEAAAEFTLSDIMKDDYINSVSGAKSLPVMLAYGSADVNSADPDDGLPLVPETTSQGYDAKYGNSGGPLKLVVGQKDENDINSSKTLKQVIRIEVTAAEQVSWNHSSSEVYKAYLNDKIRFRVVNKNNREVASEDLTVEQLEAMKDLISQEDITYDKKENTWEGLNFWRLLQQEFGWIDGMDDPTTITVKAKDGYSVEAVEKATLDGLKSGIKDGDNRVPVILAYAVDGYPLAAGGKNTATGVGYDPVADNKGGPMRLMVHNAQGACITEVTDVTIKISGIGNADFRLYKGLGEEGELPLAGIRATVPDDEGNLWIGTYGGGVAKLNLDTEEIRIYNKKSKPALNSAVVSSVCPDHNGGVWMTQNSSYTDGTLNSGVAYLKDGEITFYTKDDENPTVPSNYVQEIKIDDSGNVWFGSDVGLTEYDPEAGTWQTWGKEDGFPANSIDNIEIDEDGGIWCGFYPTSEAADGTKPFYGGFAYFKDGAVVKSYNYVSPQDEVNGLYRLGDVWIRDIALDNNGGAWIIASGSYGGMKNVGGTVWYVSGPGAEPQQFTGIELLGEEYLNGASNAELRMATVDPDGGLWLGSSADGLLYVADPTIQGGKLDVTAEFSSAMKSWPEEPVMDNIYSLDYYGDSLYIGAAGGLAIHTFKTDEIAAVEGQIDALNEEITLDDAEAISAARKAYLALGKVDSAKVTNAAKLEAAEKKLDGAMKDAFIAKADETIAAIDYTKYDATEKLNLWIAADRIRQELAKAGSAADAQALYKELEDIIANAKTAEQKLAEKLSLGNLKAKASPASYNSVNITWEGIAGAEVYEIVRAEKANGSYVTVKTTGQESYKDTIKVTGKTYYYKVRPIAYTGENVKVEGAFCDPLAVKTSMAKPAIRKVKAGKKKATITWGKVGGAEGYVIYRAAKKKGKYKAIKTIRKASTVKLVNKKLKKGKKYFYKIRAYNTVDGKRVYTGFSKVRSVKIKKK